MQGAVVPHDMQRLL